MKTKANRHWVKKIFQWSCTPVVRPVKMLMNKRRHRQMKMSRMEFLNLGEHLLRDLGFDKDGRPLHSELAQREGKNCTMNAC